jgi:DNA recombination protein RmuC
MGIDTAAVLAVLALLALGLVIIGMALLKRASTPPATAVDPSIPLLQQQLIRVAEQVASLSSQVPREVGAALTELTGQMTARLSENSQSLQKAAADTSRLIADVNVRLGELGTSSQQILDLGQEVRSLQQIFQAPKIRGGLGETSLGSLLQQIFPSDHFALQHAFQNGEIVDAVVKLPGGLVPIDSKFPLAGFRSILDSASDELRLKARKSFARDVRRHVEDIAVKYIRPAEGTLDFALMYVPAENVYYETIIRETDEGGEESISSSALRRRVIPVSPNSLYAYLQAIAFGLMGLRIEDRAREILRNLQQLHGDFGVFQEAHALGQKHLKNAQAAFSDAGDRAGRIAFQVEQFVRVAEAKPVPPPAPIRTLPR